MVGFASDGSVAMIGKCNGVAAKLKKRMKQFKGMTSFFSLHCIIHQETLCASVLNHRECAALLGEIESEHGEIIYHTNVRWSSRGSLLQLLFMEKKNKRIEELDDEGWISDLAFFVDVTGH
jgi:hypothetical protein